jgi:hypothetical protein
MRAIVLTGFGGPDVLQLSEIPAPSPGPEEVLVQVRATALNRADLLPFATATPEGIPNVVPVKYVWVAAPDRLWIADNYFDKTLANLRANPQAALYVWSADPKLCVQIKGDIRIHTEGVDYETMRARARAAGSAGHRCLSGKRSARVSAMASESHTARLPSTRTGTLPAGLSASAPCLKADVGSKSSKGSITSSKAMPAWRISTQGRMDQDE